MPFRFTIVTGVNVSCSVPSSVEMEVLLLSGSAAFSLSLPKLVGEEELAADCKRFSSSGSAAETESPPAD